jgi:hypothetical protein
MRIAFSILFLFASTDLVAAETILLARYESAGHEPPGFDFQPPSGIPNENPQPSTHIPHLVYIGTADFAAKMEIPAIPENVGKKFSLDTMSLAGLRNGLTGTGANFVVLIGREGGHSGPVIAPSYFSASDAFRHVYYSGYRAEAFVPQLGPNFSGYHIDALTVTIGDPMRIEIHGHPIPEPTLPITLLACLVLAPRLRFRIHVIAPILRHT